MLNGLAIWHYPHRNVLDNVKYFIDCGYDSVSLHGAEMYYVACKEDASIRLAALIEESGISLTVHSSMPVDHSEKAVEAFKNQIDAYAAWQRRYGLISVLSFDVPDGVRDAVTEYINYILTALPKTKVAVEDFGLNQAELSMLLPFKNNEYFGYLIDVGHMYIRMKGKNAYSLTLFQNSETEDVQSDAPDYEDFLKAFRSKSFPIFEVHLHQNDGVEDLHYFLDDGTLNVKAVAKVLREIDYKGILTLECAPGFKFECKGADADKRIQRSFDLWKSYLNEK